ncbi:MAG TPA: MFS transporter [Candidatus Dormibacteraeota bacterium]
MRVAAREVDWRRNLLALWIACFTGIVGITAMIPFVALFLTRDLGVRDPGQLALWTGAASAASGLGQAVAGPLWGALGDRFGRRPLLLRAILMGGAIMAATSLARSPQELLAYRLAFGLLAGPLPLATAIVASETPRDHVARALGVLNSGTALALAIGPAIGAVIASFADVRVVFAIAGAGLLASSIFVFAMVRESPRERPVERRSGSLRSLPRRVLHVVAVMLAAQFLASAVAVAVLPMMSLRFLALDPQRSAVLTGVGFAISGALTAVAGLTFGATVGRLGYRRTAIGAALVAAATLVVIAAPLPEAVVVAAYAVYGYTLGVLTPVTTSVMGLETPTRLHSTIFGVSGTAMAAGFTAGPLAAAGVAAAISVPAALLFAACLSAALALLVAGAMREPVAHEEPQPARVPAPP